MVATSDRSSRALIRPASFSPYRIRNVAHVGDELSWQLRMFG